MEKQRQHSNTKRFKRIVVFGIFDGLHDGHRDFFRQAREYGDALVVIVGRDKIAEQLKGKKPKYDEVQRVKFVEEEDLVDRAILGDDQLSLYEVLEEVRADVVCLGYDQEALGEDIQKWLEKNQKTIEIYYLKPYKPNIHHSSLL